MYSINWIGKSNDLFTLTIMKQKTRAIKDKLNWLIVMDQKDGLEEEIGYRGAPHLKVKDGA